MNSRQIVLDTLNFRNTSHRTARDIWLLPWSWHNHGEAVAKLQNDFPSDFGGVELNFKCKGIESGDMYEVGDATDAWGCTFHNLNRGIIGEVKKPLILDDDWDDVDKIHIPEEWLSFDVDDVNKKLDKDHSKFVLLGCPRPFEQLQFLRGTENFYMDLMTKPPKMMAFLDKMHDFYCRYLTKLAQTDVDGINFMDDWGSQNSLLINPKLWQEIFQPMYRDFIDIAKKYNKKTFMHSDGYTLDIIPKLIDLGLDAINAQIFCIGIDKLKQFKGKITFWGEIDRQGLLPHGSLQDIRDAVTKVYDALYDNGGCIAQCEFGPGGKPENVMEVYSEWNKLTTR